MTNEDRLAALGLAQEPVCKKITVENPEGFNVGGVVIRRADGRDGFGSEVAEVMIKNHGTFRWDLDDPVNGKGTFNNIYEYLAAEIHTPGGTIRERFEVAAAHEHEARSGVTSLAAWLDNQYGVPIYRVTSEEKGSKSKVVVLTLNPDQIVRDNGDTAADVQIKRDQRALLGTLGASYRRLGRELGPNEAKEILAHAASQIIQSVKLTETRHDCLTHSE